MNVNKMLGRKQSNYNIIIPSFLIGAVIGAGIAMFANSRTGEEFRHNLMETGEDIRNRVEDVANRAQNRAQTAVEKTEQQFRQY